MAALRVVHTGIEAVDNHCAQVGGGEDEGQRAPDIASFCLKTRAGAISCPRAVGEMDNFSAQVIGRYATADADDSGLGEVGLEDRSDEIMVLFRKSIENVLGENPLRLVEQEPRNRDRTCSSSVNSSPHCAFRSSGSERWLNATRSSAASMSLSETSEGSAGKASAARNDPGGKYGWRRRNIIVMLEGLRTLPDPMAKALPAQPRADYARSGSCRTRYDSFVIGGFPTKSRSPHDAVARKSVREIPDVTAWRTEPRVELCAHASYCGCRHCEPRSGEAIQISARLIASGFAIAMTRSSDTGGDDE